MKQTILLSICLTFCILSKAQTSSDSTRYDSLQLSNDIKFNNSRTYKSYHSDSSWFKSGYNNPVSNVIGRAGIISSGDYTSNLIAPQLSYRNIGESLVMLNGVPMNTFDILTNISNSDQLNTQVDYISPLDVQNISMVKGNKLSSVYGAFGSNSGLLLNSDRVNKKGLNFTFNSGYSVVESKSSDFKSTIFRNGLRTSYASNKISSSLVTEYLYSKSDNTINSKLNGYYISNNTVFDITKKISISTYLNKYHESIDRSGSSSNFKNDRLIGSLNVNYTVLDFLALNTGFSVLKLDKLFTESSTDNFEQSWNQKYFYLQANLNKDITESVGAHLNVGLRKMQKKEELSALSGGSTNTAAFENDLDYIYADLSFDLKKMVYLGYSVNREKNSSLAPDNDVTNYKTLYSSFIFSELIADNPILSNGLIRMNYSNLGDNIKMYEIGTELGFLQNRLSTSLAYFNNKQDDTIGEVTWSGVEVEVYAKPTRFWNVMVNWASFNSEVAGLSAGLDSGLGGFGTNGDDPIIPGVTNLGSFNPDWNMTLYNDFSIKKINAGFLLSYRKGGNVFTLTRDEFGLFSNTLLDSSGLILRNIYFNYTLKDIINLSKVEVGISAQNIFSSTNLPDNEIPQDAGISSFSSADVKSINLNFKIDF